MDFVFCFVLPKASKASTGRIHPGLDSSAFCVFMRNPLETGRSVLLLLSVQLFKFLID